jgi:Bacteriocin-protection, YdeI or OmpD-Associated/Domain of unknown function (DUF1905)
VPAPSTPKPMRFMATIYKIWMMRHVDVPEEIAATLRKQIAAATPPSKRAGDKKSKYIPVLSIVAGKSVRTTIVPAGGGKHRMQINTAQRKAAKVDWGDPVSIELRIDVASRTVPVPADLRALLDKHPKARRGFDEMPPGHRRQFLLWLGSSKNPETRRKHLDRAVDHLIERAIMKPR